MLACRLLAATVTGRLAALCASPARVALGSRISLLVLLAQLTAAYYELIRRPLFCTEGSCFPFVIRTASDQMGSVLLSQPTPSTHLVSPAPQPDIAASLSVRGFRPLVSPFRCLVCSSLVLLECLPQQAPP